MMSSLRAWAGDVSAFLATVGCLLLGACAGGRYDSHLSGGGEALGSSDVAQVEVPPDATEYSTSAGSHGVRGGENARAAERILQDELVPRGDQAEPDAALAATAAWLLHTAYVGQNNTSDATEITLATQRFGFAGSILGSATGNMGAEAGHDALRDILSQVPKNTPINRYGIAAGRGQDVAIVFGLVDASLEAFPRSVAPGGTVRLKGGVGSRFERASVFATSPRGRSTNFR